MHLYLAEAINSMKLESFKNWLVTRNEYRIYEEMKENGDVQNFKQFRDTENFEQCVEEFRPLLELYEEFEELFPNAEEYPVAAFWNSYLGMIQTLRDFIKSVQNGDWDLHMYASEKMLYWFHAYDNYNYARPSDANGLHNKRYLNIIQQYMKNLKKVVFLFDVLLTN